MSANPRSPAYQVRRDKEVMQALNDSIRHVKNGRYANALLHMLVAASYLRDCCPSLQANLRMLLHDAEHETKL